MASVSFSFAFSFTTKIIKKIIKNNKKKKEMVLILARSTLNSIETLIFQELIDSEINHEEYTTIINEEEKYRGYKNNEKSKKLC